MKGRFTRASGAGNTFFIANVFDSDWSAVFSRLTPLEKIQMTQRICNQFDGFKTDGLLFLKPEKNFDFSWEFFNSDGSTAEMCGNAARCASLFFYEKIKKQKHLRFQTGAGEIRGDITENSVGQNEVRVQMTTVHGQKEMTVLGQAGLYVNSGVPHFVIEKTPQVDLAKKLRQVQDFGAAGANITFVKARENELVEAVTFERGVENFTQACGTGAIAAAVWFQKQAGQKKIVQVQMPGGNLLVEGAQEGHQPWLSGPTKLEFEMTVLGE